MSLEEYRAGDMLGALPRAYLRLDERMLQDDQQEELRKLAGDPETGKRCARSASDAF
jgi:hypothetical protein